MGCKRIYRDQLSGKDADRPGLTSALEQLLEGDTLVVTELSRLGRFRLRLGSRFQLRTGPD